MKKIKIVLLYASVGTGHKMAAFALKEWMMCCYPACEILCLDMLDFVPAWMRRVVCAAYIEMAGAFPKCWKWFYEHTDRPDQDKATFWGALHAKLCAFYAPLLLYIVKDFAPQAVVFTHFFGLDAVSAQLKGVPLYYVNTDFISHALCRNKKFSAFFVASEEALKQHKGLNARLTGIPVMPYYSQNINFNEGEKNKRQKPLVTVMSGSIGIGPIEKIISSCRALDCNILAVCGNNAKLKARLSSKFAHLSNVKIEGFIDMKEIYRSCDLAVMKPGGLSSSEALCAGVPMIITNPIPGQERFNADFLIKHGAAVEAHDINNISRLIEQVLGDESNLIKKRQAALKLARPYAGKDIAKYIIEGV